jgi:zinc-ribbon domain
MSTDPASRYCVVCGERLQRDHRFCPACGAERWSPMLPGSLPPPPAVAADEEPAPVPGLAWVYAAGAVMWLVLLAINAGEVAAGPSRAQMATDVRAAGYGGDLFAPMLVAYAVAMVLVPAVIAAIHAVAFYGLRAQRRWGWLAAVVVAGAWSLVLVGVPVLATLLRPAVRRAYGVG